MEIKPGLILQHLQDKNVMVLVTKVATTRYKIRGLSEKGKDWVYNCSPESSKLRMWREPDKNKIELVQKLHRFNKTWKISKAGNILYGKQL